MVCSTPQPATRSCRKQRNHHENHEPLRALRCIVHRADDGGAHAGCLRQPTRRDNGGAKSGQGRRVRRNRGPGSEAVRQEGPGRSRPGGQGDVRSGGAKSVDDMAITAAVKADIAKDKELSALRVNVDTKDGRVSLYGSAPSAAAKERAQTIAMSQKGVTGVDNKLALEAR